MTCPIEPIDYRLHPAFYGISQDTPSSKKDLSDFSPTLTESGIWLDDEALKNKKDRKEAIQEIALFILAGALFFMGGAAVILGAVLLATTSLPGLPVLIGGSILFLTSLIIFYSLFKGPHEPIESV